MKKKKISETAFDDALVDDSDHSSTECILDDPEVNDRQHASTDQSTTSTSAYDISRAVQLKKSRCLSDAEKFNFFIIISFQLSTTNFQQNSMGLANAAFNILG